MEELVKVNIHNVLAILLGTVAVVFVVVLSLIVCGKYNYSTDGSYEVTKTRYEVLV